MLTAILITLAIALPVGGLTGAGIMHAAGGAQARVAEAQAQAVGEAAAAGPAGTEAALAPVRDQLRELGGMLAAPPPYCVAGDDYDKMACLAERVCTRAGITKDGGDALGCDKAMNAVLSEHEITTVEKSKDKATADYRAGVFSRRK